MSAIFKFEKKGVRKFPRYLQISEACTSCGWCVKNCPRRNIELINARPTFDGQCVACLRCIYGCPSKAIHTSKLSFMTIKEGYDFQGWIFDRATYVFARFPGVASVPPDCHL
jgi:ferredoxin